MQGKLIRVRNVEILKFYALDTSSIYKPNCYLRYDTKFYLVSPCVASQELADIQSKPILVFLILSNMLLKALIKQSSSQLSLPHGTKQRIDE